MEIEPEVLKHLEGEQHPIKRKKKSSKPIHLIIQKCLEYLRFQICSILTNMIWYNDFVKLKLCYLKYQHKNSSGSQLSMTQLHVAISWWQNTKKQRTTWIGVEETVLWKENPYLRKNDGRGDFKTRMVNKSLLSNE